MAKTNEIRLRSWQMTDLGNLLRYANNQKLSENLMDRFPFPYTAEDGRAFLAFASTVKEAWVLAIDLDGDAIGGISVEPLSDVYRRNAELGYWLAEPYWGRGIMTAAIGQMVERVFAGSVLDRIFARPFGSNRPSHRILEKNGFILEARFDKTVIKNGRLEDEYVYAIRRQA